MTDPDAYRKYSAIGAGGSGQVFTIPFGIDTIDELFVYEGNSLAVVDEDYSVTNFGIPTDQFEAESFTVTWIGKTSALVIYSFYRSSARTQLTSIPVAADGNDIERVVRRMSYQCQESIFATLEILDADNMRIQTLAAPIESEDIATYLYAQARFSSQGYFPPPASGIDENNILYSSDQNSLVWKNPFSVPTAPATNRFLYVAPDGQVVWQKPPTWAPALPSVPSFLAVSATGMAIEWRVAADLPSGKGVKYNDAVTAQQGGTVAWENVEDLPPLPNINDASSLKYVLSMWSKDAITSTDVSVNFTEVTYLDEGNPTTAQDGTDYSVLASTGGTRKSILMQVDLTSSGIISDSIVSAKVSMMKSHAPVGTDSATAYLARMNQDWTESTATFNTYDGSNEWPGGPGGFAAVDNKNFIYPLIQHGGDTNPAGARYYWDATNLVKDAIDKRNGVLNLYAYYPEPVSPMVWANWYSNEPADLSKRPRVEIKHSFSARQAKWLAVAWGTVEFTAIPSNSWDTKSITGLFLREDETIVDILQPHLLGIDKVDVVHNFGMPNVYGVVNCQTTSGVAGDESAYTTAIDASGSDSATIYFFNNGYDFFQETATGSQLGSPVTMVATYTIWSPDTSQATSGGEGGSCG